jgi:hypothetical protein
MDHLQEDISDACASKTQEVLQGFRHEWERHIRMRYQCNGGHVAQVLQINILFFSHVWRIMNHPAFVLN